MRSLILSFFFFLSEKWMYRTWGRVSSDTQMHVAGVLTDTLGQKTFFSFFRAVTLHVSCCYGDVSRRSSRARGLAGEERGEGKAGTGRYGERDQTQR